MTHILRSCVPGCLGTCAYIEYLRQGWWTREMHVVRAIIYAPDGTPRLRLGGWWSRELWVEAVEPFNNPGVAKLIPASEVAPSEEVSSSSPNDTPSHLHSDPSNSSFVPFGGETEPEEEMHGNRSRANSDLSGANEPYYHARDPTAFNSEY